MVLNIIIWALVAYLAMAAITPALVVWAESTGAQPRSIRPWRQLLLLALLWPRMAYLVIGEVRAYLREAK